MGIKKSLLLAISLILALPSLAQLNIKNPFFVASLLKTSGGGLTFPSGAVAGWKFDEASGNATDFYTGNDLIDGVVVGPIAHSTFVFANGVSFVNGHFDEMHATDSADLSFGANIDGTIAGWIILTNLAANKCIYSKDSDGNGYELTVLTTGKLRFSIWNTSVATDFDSTGTLSTSTQYHVAWTYDQSNIRLYINGSLDSTQMNTTDIPDDGNQFTLGFSDANGTYRYNDGKIDDLWIWHRALSGTEIGDLYNGARP